MQRDRFYYVLIFVACVGAGCSKTDQEREESTPQAEADKVPEAFKPIPIRVPTLTAEHFCDVELVPVPLSWCDWAATNDTVVLAEITGVTAVLSPQTHANEFHDAPECLVPVRPALRFSLHVLEVLSGAVGGHDLDAYAGSGHVSFWDPSPQASADGSLYWDSGAPVDEAPFQAGGTVILALSIDRTEQRWSLMGEHPIAFDENGLLVESQGTAASCQQYPRPSASGMTLTQFADALGNCPSSTELSATVSQWKHTVEGTPAKAYAADCPKIQVDPVDQGKCIVKADCPGGYVCNNQECVLPNE